MTSSIDKDKPPEYTKKVNITLEELENGTTRDELAKMFDYSSWKSLDTYMRRKGFRYEAEIENYVPYNDGNKKAINNKEDCVEENENKKEKNNKSEKPEDNKICDEKCQNNLEDKIICLFADGEMEPLEIAIEAGFEDHRDMAAYMADRGYKWNGEEENYFKDYENESENYEKYKGLSCPGGGKNSKIARKEIDRKVNNGKHTDRGVEDNCSICKVISLAKDTAKLLEIYSLLDNVKEDEIVENALKNYFNSNGFLKEIESKFN